MLWVGTYGGGLNRFDRSLGQFARYDTDDFQNITDEPEEYRNAVAAVDEYPTGVLWIATHGRELVKFDLETATFTSYAPDPVDLGFWGHEWITALLVGSSGMLWLGTNSEGLYRFDPVTGQTTSYRHDPADPHSLSNDYIPSIIEDEGGTLWIGTSGGGLDAFDPRTETFTHVHHDAIDPSSLSSDRIQTLFLSQSGILWVGTQGGGVNKSDPASGRFTHYRGDPDDPQRRSDYPVSSLLEDEDDTLLEQEGLVAALQAQLQAVEGRAGLRTEPKTDVKERLPADVEEGLYRIAVEALNNALKHAQARNIEVRVSRDRRTVTLTIADDGIGLDLAAARGRGGMGLLAMEERVQEMGGTFAIESTPEQGTRIIVSVP
jgi:ligand-binding sensor domain-containing protein/anti-sigma regulatory factor (Ser/Thr protein kinase)